MLMKNCITHRLLDVKWYRHTGKKTCKYHTTSSRTPGHHTREMKTLCLLVFPLHKYLQALFITAKNWKQIRCSSIGKLLNKQWYSHNTEYNTAIKRNKSVIHTTWLNLQKIMLGEKSQSQKVNTVQFYLHNILGIGRTVEMKNKLADARIKERVETRDRVT